MFCQNALQTVIFFIVFCLFHLKSLRIVFRLSLIDFGFSSSRITPSLSFIVCMVLFNKTHPLWSLTGPKFFFDVQFRAKSFSPLSTTRLNLSSQTFSKESSANRLLSNKLIVVISPVLLEFAQFVCILP